MKNAKGILVANGQYYLSKKIGAGSFGDIYIGKAVDDESVYVGVKLESSKSTFPQLEIEYQLYNSLSGGTGIPKAIYFGTEGDWNVLVIELLGPCLERLLTYCGQTFSLKTVLMMADQIITRVETVHERGFVHRDIKPDNFLMGLGPQANKVYVIDFGLAKRYVDPVTNCHYRLSDNKRLTGTARYASINAHLGIEQSRRDDLEAIGYMLVYFLKGVLPWQGIKEPNKKKKYDKIRDSKLSTPIELLCSGLPGIFVQYFNYCRALEYDEDPDYNYLRKLMRSCFLDRSLRWDYIFDWTVLKFKAVQEAQAKEKAALAKRQESMARQQIAAA